MKDIRVRYAPSPTGYLHIGNARTALFNYLFAKHYNGKFIIRIEDTDLNRNVEDGVKSQLENLKWLGITWDESIDQPGQYGPYAQIERYNEGVYQPFIGKLLEKKLAYRCFCTSEELDAETERQKANGEIPKYSGKCSCLSDEEIQAKLDANIPYSIRFKVPKNYEIKWNDIVKGEISFNSDSVSGDFNIVKQNGIPTYNFAVVIDDYLMKISHVLRGEDHISNTPKQIMLYEALELEKPEFGHMSLIVNLNGKKLSKRDSDIIQFIEEYKDLGYLPEALFNFISLLGWSPEGEEEIFSQQQLIELFDTKRLSKSSAKFDVNKLNWINSQYIKQLSDEDYLAFLKPFIEKIDLREFNQDQINNICLIFKDQLTYGAEIIELINEILDNNLENDAKEFILENDAIGTIMHFKEKFEILDEIDEVVIKNLIKEVGKDLDIKGKNLFMPIRIGISGKMHGPELPIIINFLGKNKIIERLSINLDILK